LLRAARSERRSAASRVVTTAWRGAGSSPSAPASGRAGFRRMAETGLPHSGVLAHRSARGSAAAGGGRSLLRAVRSERRSAASRGVTTAWRGAGSSPLPPHPAEPDSAAWRRQGLRIPGRLGTAEVGCYSPLPGDGREAGGGEPAVARGQDREYQGGDVARDQRWNGWAGVGTGWRGLSRCACCWPVWSAACFRCCPVT